jgi:tripeptide aminopeptidase
VASSSIAQRTDATNGSSAESDRLMTPRLAAGPTAEPGLDRALDLVLDLMVIPGRSGEEGPVAEYIQERLLFAGASSASLHTDAACRRTPLAGQTGNLVLKLPGTVRAPRRLFSAHMDTVPICIGARPIRDGDLIRSADPETGLGADDRSGVAVILNTALEILERGLPHPPLTFCWFVQEEVGLQGSRYVSKRLLGKPQLAFNWDGGSPSKLTLGATGGYRMTIDIRGLASHAGGAPEWGVSAITIAALAIADLQQRGWHGDIRQGRRRGTSNVGVIQGGTATNVVPDRVRIEAEARSHSPSMRRRIVREMTDAFQRAARDVRNVAGVAGRVGVDGRLDYESYRLNKSEPCVRFATAAARAVGRVPEFAVANGGIDANWLVRHGIPAVSMGCGAMNPHTVDEALNVPEFQDACRMALYLATAATDG